jgi:hypothetical protein
MWSTREEVLYSYRGQFSTNSAPVELINYICNYSKEESYSAPLY